jgi:hypothetical protein
LGCLGTNRGRRTDTATAQGIGGARSGPVRDGTPEKPGFLRSKKCAQIILCKEKYYIHTRSFARQLPRFTQIALAMLSIISVHPRNQRTIEGGTQSALPFRDLPARNRLLAHPD